LQKRALQFGAGLGAGRFLDLGQQGQQLFVATGRLHRQIQTETAQTEGGRELGSDRLGFLVTVLCRVGLEGFGNVVLRYRLGSLGLCQKASPGARAKNPWPTMWSTSSGVKPRPVAAASTCSTVLLPSNMMKAVR